MNRLSPPLFLLAILFLTSCGQVTTLTPVIEETELDLQEEFTGAWKMGEGIFHVAFDDRKRGQFAWIDREDGEFIMGKGELHVMVGEKRDTGYLSLRVQEEEEEQAGYVFAGFRLMDAGTIIVWNAGPLEKYEELLSSGILKGEVSGKKHGKKVTFEEGPTLTQEVSEFSTFFDLENPLVMTRVLPQEK